MPPPPNLKVYTFWEPKGRMPAYLRLCMQTWQAQLGRHEIVVLDYAALPELLGDGGLDLEAIVHFPLALQKDAILVAVLRRHGGVFIDADTLMTRPLDSLLDALADSEVLQIGQHLAFLAARPGARLFEPWYVSVSERIARSRPETARTARWDYLGNQSLLDAMDQLIADDRHKPGLVAAFDRALAGIERMAQGTGPIAHAAARVWSSLSYRRRTARFGTGYRTLYRSFDRVAEGFMPELAHFEGTGLDAAGRYRRFWFEPSLPVEAALSERPRLIGLHNSWTPPWYAALSEDEVLGHPCLLSRTLRVLLGR